VTRGQDGSWPVPEAQVQRVDSEPFLTRAYQLCFDPRWHLIATAWLTFSVVCGLTRHHGSYRIGNAYALLLFIALFTRSAPGLIPLLRSLAGESQARYRMG
jgi:hypothetical protein